MLCIPRRNHPRRGRRSTAPHASTRAAAAPRSPATGAQSRPVRRLHTDPTDIFLQTVLGSWPAQLHGDTRHVRGTYIDTSESARINASRAHHTAALSSRRRAPSLPSNMDLRRSNSGHAFTSYGCGLHCGGESTLSWAVMMAFSMLSHEKESACARRVSTAGRTGCTDTRPHACIGPHTEHPSSAGSGVRICRRDCRDLRVLLLDAERHPVRRPSPEPGFSPGY